MYVCHQYLQKLSFFQFIKIATKIILYIGAPGTGKTFRINQLRQECKSIVFTPTNSSAELCGGMTFYKYLNCTPFNIQDVESKKFDKDVTIIIDEIFMFTAEIFNKILECKPSKIICFGDPFQIHQSNQSYWYRDVDIENVEIKYLKKYYRAKDKKLQKLLEDYRKNKKIDISSLQQISKIDARLIEQYIKCGWTLLAGKKSAIKYYGKKFKYDFVDKAGTQWYYGQRVMQINQYGNCQQITQILDYKDDIIYLSNGQICKPKKRGNKIIYFLERADLMTVNLAQGQTLKGVILDMQSFFEFGSAYTAISRVRKMNDIKLVSYPIVEMEVDYNCEFVY